MRDLCNMGKIVNIFFLSGLWCITVPNDYFNFQVALGLINRSRFSVAPLPLGSSPIIIWVLFPFWYNLIFQVHFVLVLPLHWYQLRLQGDLVPFSGKWSGSRCQVWSLQLGGLCCPAFSVDRAGNVGMQTHKHSPQCTYLHGKCTHMCKCT
jgi:hypothetical protein